MSNIYYTPLNFNITTNFNYPFIDNGRVGLLLSNSDSEVHYYTLGDGNDYSFYRSSLPTNGSNGNALIFDNNNYKWTANSDIIHLSNTEIIINNSDTSSFETSFHNSSNLKIFYSNYDNDQIRVSYGNPVVNEFETSFQINSNKPMVLPRLSDTDINLISPVAGMVCYDKTNENLIGVVGSSPSWRRLDNPLNHEGCGTSLVTVDAYVNNYQYLIFFTISNNISFSLNPNSSLDYIDELTFYIVNLSSSFKVNVNDGLKLIDGLALYEVLPLSRVKVVYSKVLDTWMTIK